MKKMVLGKGLAALIPTAEPEGPSTNEKYLMLQIDSLTANPKQPRMFFEEEKLALLAESIAQKGMLQPILVRPVDSGYQIVAGERRYRAAEKLGIVSVATQNIPFQ